MPTSVADKLCAVVTEIEERGNADRLRLTVLKKWFERPGRLTSFALWVARRAAYRGGERREAGMDLVREAQALLKGVESSGSLDRRAAERLHHRLHTYQSVDGSGMPRIVGGYRRSSPSRAVDSGRLEGGGEGWGEQSGDGQPHRILRRYELGKPAPAGTA